MSGVTDRVTAWHLAPQTADAVSVAESQLDFELRFAPTTRRAAARVCVVAEIGVNHDGQLGRAHELVDAAAECGADAVKFQIFDPQHLLSNQARLAHYQKDEADDVFAMLDGLWLGADDLLAVRAAARQRGLGFVVTPFSLESVEALRVVQPDAVKIASPDAVNTPLLDAADELGRPMIISTGTCKLTELGYAAGLVRDRPAGGCLLQCVSSYPTPLGRGCPWRHPGHGGALQGPGRLFRSHDGANYRCPGRGRWCLRD